MIGINFISSRFRTLFEWAKMIHNPELKVAVDFAICSVCRHHPDIFTSLLYFSLLFRSPQQSLLL